VSDPVPAGASAPVRRDSPLPAWAWAALYGVAWLPSFMLLLFFVPRFDTILKKLEPNGELPALTGGLLWCSDLNQASFGLPALSCFTLVVLADIVVGGRLGRRGTLYSAWFSAGVILGVIAFLLAALALLLPVFKMGTAVG
jgi:hypothetical protein